MSLKWFKIMIEERRNTLLRPSSWDDPHEMNYSRSVIATKHGDLPLDASHWFGQSWSTCQENLIMWQSFKKDKEPYVKIKTDVNGLIKGLNIHDKELRIAIVETVRYFEPTINDYREKLHDLMYAHQWLENFKRKGLSRTELYPAYSLLTKRDIYKHEEEVRLLLLDKSSSEKQESVKYSYDPSSIKEVVVDPWTSLDEEKYNEIEKELRKTLLDESILIKKSEIFNDSSKFSIRYIE